MYKTVYWHKTVRIATAMIKKVVAEALAEGELRKEELYGLDDEEFFARFTSRRWRGFSLIEDTRRRILHKQVLRVPFDEGNAVHRRLEDIGERLKLELAVARDAAASLGREVPPEAIVVDVPERISFELKLPVLDLGAQEDPGETDAGEASHVFNRIGNDDFPAPCAPSPSVHAATRRSWRSSTAWTSRGILPDDGIHAGSCPTA